MRVKEKALHIVIRRNIVYIYAQAFLIFLNVTSNKVPIYVVEEH